MIWSTEIQNFDMSPLSLFGYNQQLSRDARASAAFRLMQDLGAFSSFTGPSNFKKEESAIRRVISSIDHLLPSDRDRKLKQQSSKILNYYTVDQLQQHFGFVRNKLDGTICSLKLFVSIMRVNRSIGRFCCGNRQERAFLRTQRSSCIIRKSFIKSRQLSI